MHVDDDLTLATVIRSGRSLDVLAAVSIVARASRLFAVRGCVHVITPERIVITRRGDVRIDETLPPSENLGYLPLEVLEAANNRTLETENRDVGPAAVFALGCTLWELLAGELLFTAENHVQAFERARTADVPVLPNVPATLEAILVKALAKSVEGRYSNPGQLAAALEEWLVAFQPATLN